MDWLVHLVQQCLIVFHSAVPNWGLTIILFTTAIRLLLLPLQLIIIREQAKLKRLKPDLDRLQSKYKDDQMRFLKERSALLKKTGARPGMSMIASFIQLPVWMSMYRAISSTSELTRASFAWVTNLAAPDALFILPVLSALLIWFQSRTAGPAPSPVALLVPLLSLGFLAVMPAGLALYSVTSSAIQLAIQRSVIGVAET